MGGASDALETVRAIERLVEPTLRAMGYELVRVRFSGEQRRTLQVMAERHDATPMTVDDCAAISNAVSPLLDVEDLVRGAYDLEVSSPGIDRPLVKLADFVRFIGFEAKLQTTQMFDGRKRFRGRLAGVGDESVQIDIGPPAGVMHIPLGSIADAKLVLSDELIAATQRRN